MFYNPDRRKSSNSLLFVFGTPSMGTMLPEIVILAITYGRSPDRIDIETANLATGMYGGNISASNGKLLINIGEFCVNRTNWTLLLLLINI